MSLAETNTRIERIEAIEKEISLALESAGMAVTELAKETSSQTMANAYATNFLQHLQRVETGLSEQIAYLGQVSSSSVCGNTPRLAELKVAHTSQCARDAHRLLEERLAAASGKVTRYSCEEGVQRGAATAAAAGQSAGEGGGASAPVRTIATITVAKGETLMDVL
ncbi:uncharacterized protein LOC135811854 [Sycon ciliatum]|uniref:uncharacterized protein LOC135811854 n=1 Tax=Sycon ciliatum TaxID=27933 RepID=UPI0031F6C2B0